MKGILQSLEAIIGILMIMTTFIIVYTGREQIPEFDTINWKLRGFGALEALDNNNKLRDVVLSNSTQTLKSRLSDLLPSGLNYDVVICVSDCGKPSIPSERIASVIYLISGDVDDFRYRQVILYMW